MAEKHYFYYGKTQATGSGMFTEFSGIVTVTGSATPAEILENTRVTQEKEFKEKVVIINFNRVD